MLDFLELKPCLALFQERPSASEKFKEKLPPSAVKDNIVGVKLGAGDRSYIIRDKKIEVLKNVHGGVQVSRSILNLI